MKKKILSLALTATMALAIVPFGGITRAYAMSNADILTPIEYEMGSYTVIASSLNVRSGPSTSYSKVTTLSENSSVIVNSISDGWGKVQVSGKSGWINLSYTYNKENDVDVESRLDMLRKKFPDGTYWNREDASINNADGYTNKPCEPNHADNRENYFDGTCQCHGFALKLGYDLFGIHASNWERHYDINKVQVGDLIRYRSKHTVMVTGVYEDYFTVADCNWDYSCGIDWDRVMKKSYISFTQNQYDGIYHCQINDNYVGSSGQPTATSQPTTTSGKTTILTEPSTTTTATTTATTTSTSVAATENENSSGKLTITGDIVNVRLGAGTNYLTIGIVKKGQSYTYNYTTTENGEKWYFIKLDFFRRGWVNGNYVKVNQSTNTTVSTSKNTTTSKATTASKATTTTKATTTSKNPETTTASITTTKKNAYTTGKLKITGDVVNVRSGAGTNYKVVTSVKANASYTYTKEKNAQGKKWYYIKVSSSKSGWICGNYVKITQKIGAEIPQTSSKKIKVSANLLNVRANASTKSKIITQVKKNAVYSYTSKKTVNGIVWYKITVNSSKTGWVSGEYCRIV